MIFKKTISLFLISMISGCTFFEDPSDVSEKESFKESIEESESADIQKESSTYATVYANNQTVFVYGYVGKNPFDLTSIKVNKVLGDEIEYSLSNSNVSIKDNKLSFDKKGTTTIKVTNKDKSASLTYVVSISDNKNNMYHYPYNIDLDSYTLESGNDIDVNIENNKINLNSTSTWTRITYELDEQFANNYIIEADFTINSTYNNDSTRWAGIVFKDNETVLKKYPLYQFGFRQNMSNDNGIELTKYYGYSSNNYQYSYLYQGKNEFESSLVLNQKNHVLLYVNDNNVKGYINNNLVLENSITDSVGNKFGFQSGGCNITFENIQISYKKDDLECNRILPSSDNTNTRIEINTASLMPNIIASGNDDLDIMNYGNQYYFIAKKDDDSVTLYDIDNNKTDLSLEYMLLWYKEDMIPNIEVNDNQTLELVAEIIKANNLEDFNIWSKSIELLSIAHQMLPKARLGYVADDNENVTTSEDVGNLAHKAGASNAYLVMIDVDKLNKDNVSWFTQRGYTAVANASNGNVLAGALDGCSLIVTKISNKASNDINLLASFASKSLLSKPIATGHRGAGTNGDTYCSGGTCENTLSSYDKAFELGADAIEIDVHTCKVDASNKNACNLAVIHDDTTASISNTSLKVSTSTITQLKALTIKNTTDHIPSLDEVFERYSTEKYKDKTIVLEVKDCSYNTGVASVELAKKYNFDKRIVLIVFDSRVCAKLHQTYPQIPVSYLNTVYRTDSDSYWDTVNTYFNNGVGLSSQWSTLNEYVIKQSNARGYLYWLWTYNRSNNNYLANHLSWGNKCFTTNNLPSFTKNAYMLKTNTNLSLAKNSSTTITASTVSYLEEVNCTNFEIILVSGNAKIEGTKITKLDDKEVQVFLRVKNNWEDYLSKDTILSNYYIYSELITIK